MKKCCNFFVFLSDKINTSGSDSDVNFSPIVTQKPPSPKSPEQTDLPSFSPLSKSGTEENKNADVPDADELCFKTFKSSLADLLFEDDEQDLKTIDSDVVLGVEAMPMTPNKGGNSSASFNYSPIVCSQLTSKERVPSTKDASADTPDMEQNNKGTFKTFETAADMLFDETEHEEPDKDTM